MKLYSPPDPAVWTGRVDATGPRDALRWHQVVRCADLGRIRLGDEGSPGGFCIVGYACDEGVARNLGRRGAARGPLEIRRRLANLPLCFPESVCLVDGGDVRRGGGSVESAQEALADVVGEVVGSCLMPVVLGGGHDLAYGHYLGLSRSLAAGTRLGVLSFDAHFDLRPLDQGANSGTSFTQIARHCEAVGRGFEYLCIGIQRSANTARLFRTADELGVEYLLARDVVDHDLDRAGRAIDRFCERVDAIYVTLCADVISSAFAPGVSASQPLGLHPETVLRLLKMVLRSGKVVAFDVAEVSPRFDNDGNTAKLAAVLVYALVDALTDPLAG